MLYAVIGEDIENSLTWITTTSEWNLRNGTSWRWCWQPIIISEEQDRCSAEEGTTE